MDQLHSNRVRLICMLSLTIAFFLVELVVSRVSESLAMLSDSFHMLSDVIALTVALVAVKFAEQTEATSKNTFGWIRAEVMGALVNAVFLTALCFTIVLEAVGRFMNPQPMRKPLLVFGVGLGGLLINVIGLCIFRGHSHGHGDGHGHGHPPPPPPRGHGHGHGKPNSSSNGLRGHDGVVPGERSHFISSVTGTAGTSTAFEEGVPAASEMKTEGKAAASGGALHMNGDPSGGITVQVDGEDSESQMNMHGVFLHVLGDALGSVVVVVNSLVYYFFEESCKRENESGEKLPACWVVFLDPSLCLVIVGILLGTTFPLLRESGLILLQTVPKHIDVRQLLEKLRSVDGVLAVHELHVWQLAGSRIIATAHIKCQDPASYMETAKRIKAILHDEGIHATTVQPEFADDCLSGSRMALCDLSCQTQCARKQCCTTVGKAAVMTGDGCEKSAESSQLVQQLSLETIRETPEPSRESPARSVQEKSTD
uniref:Solute carrier family 30 member 1a n=1 Tax=Eptatretus burgeri TaxID=7764 RepID=A0A8C4Q8V2_EPTBU